MYLNIKHRQLGGFLLWAPKESLLICMYTVFFIIFYHRLFLSLGKIFILKKFGVSSNNLEFKSSYNFQDNVINSLLSYELPSL